MVKINKNKGAQALPLNTIVIAILVIIVLLVIIVFFTSNVGKSSGEINQLRGCDISNTVISSMGYIYVYPETNVEVDNVKCSDTTTHRITVIPAEKELNADGSEKNTLKICCGRKE